MKIAILASEGAPYVKSGGLGDVMEALPAALSRIEGNEVVLLLPYYKKIRENPAYEVEHCPVPRIFGLAAAILRCYETKKPERQCAGIFPGQSVLFR